MRVEPGRSPDAACTRPVTARASRGSRSTPSGFARYSNTVRAAGRHEQLGRHARLQAQLRDDSSARAASTSTVATNQDSPLSGARHPVGRHEHDLAGQQRRGARVECAQAHLGRRVLAHVVDVLAGGCAPRPRASRAPARRRGSAARGPITSPTAATRSRHHLAVDRRAHELALDLVLRRAQPLFELAHPRPRPPSARRRPALVLVAGLRDARLQLGRRAGARARGRCGTRPRWPR